MIQRLNIHDVAAMESESALRCASVARPTQRRESLVVFVAVLLISAIYLVDFVSRGWIPNDEGLLAHTAERVLAGELPHRDFDDAYTGGLAMLHAAAFKLGGIKLTSLRWMLFGFTLAFVAATHWIAARAARPWVAGLVTLLCVTWTLPNYFASLPSWYNLFFATFGLVALLRYIDTERSRWLVVAGLCGGAAMLIKIVALYYIAAVLLFLIYREQLVSARETSSATPRSAAWSLLITAVAVCFSCLLIVFIRRNLDPMEILTYVVPGTLSAGVLITNEWLVGRGNASTRLRRLAAMVLPLACGVAIPLLLFVVPYVVSGSLGQLLDGVFVLPLKRLQHVAYALPDMVSLLFVIPSALLLAIGFNDARMARRALAGVIILMAGALIVASRQVVIGQAVWFSLKNLLPFVALAASWLLIRSPSSETVSSTRRQEIYLLTTVAALVALVQYPFAAPIYFCYSAPLMILAVEFIMTSQPRPALRLGVGALVLYLAFAVGWGNTSYVYSLGRDHASYAATHRLNLDRAGLSMPEEEERLYARLVAEIERLSAPGSFIYAAPDCPEVYFLSNRRNPTRTMYDVFDEPVGRTERILKLLEEKQVEVVVIRLDSKTSDPLHADIARWVKERYPQRLRIGPFIVAGRNRTADIAAQANESLRESGSTAN